jgi:NAD(P)-dependent dehydrogenase (short-subunit alcohol dehydrogenase family)
MTEKTALVTGCSQGGLGEALAKAFRARGFRVFAALRNPAKAGPLANQEGIEIVELDVASQESIDKCVKSIEKLTGGTLDVLVNNAASTAADASVKPLLDVSIAEAKKAYEVNVWAILAMAQAFAPLLIKARGVICNINSVFCEITHAWTGTLYMQTGL